MVTDGVYAYGGHNVMYKLVDLLRCTNETNIHSMSTRLKVFFLKELFIDKDVRICSRKYARKRMEKK